MALYAFGGGGSGAAMRLSGFANWDEGTISAATLNPAVETLVPGPIVVPHEVIATQQGIAADLHGFGCSLFVAGNLWSEPS